VIPYADQQPMACVIRNAKGIPNWAKQVNRLAGDPGWIWDVVAYEIGVADFDRENSCSQASASTWQGS
jgi:hypothetical protein